MLLFKFFLLRVEGYAMPPAGGVLVKYRGSMVVSRQNKKGLSPAQKTKKALRGCFNALVATELSHFYWRCLPLKRKPEMIKNRAVAISIVAQASLPKWSGMNGLNNTAMMPYAQIHFSWLSFRASHAR